MPRASVSSAGKALRTYGKSTTGRASNRSKLTIKEEIEDEPREANADLVGSYYTVPFCAKDEPTETNKPKVITPSGSRTYDCHLCSAWYISVQSLKNHLAHDHNEIEIEYQQTELTSQTNLAIGNSVRQHLNNTQMSQEETSEDKSDATISGILKRSRNLTRIREEEDAESVEKVLPLSAVVHPSISYTCHLCQSFYASHIHLNNHLAYDHREVGVPGEVEVRPGGGLYPCDLCPRNLKCRSELNNHRRIHTGFKPYVCPFCPDGKRFYHSANVKVHLKKHHSGEEWTMPRPFGCTTCGEAFVEEHHLEDHLATHRREEREMRQQEEEEQRIQEEIAIREATPRRPSKSERRRAKKLEKTLKRKAAKEAKAPRPPQKATIWPRPGPWESEVEPQSAATSIIPPGTTSYDTVSCPLCPLQAKACTLSGHLSIHLLGRPWRCPLCPSTFARCDFLKSHQSRTHPDEGLTDEELKLYQNQPPDTAQESGALYCPLCPAASYSESKLKAHLEAHTADQTVTCTVCGIPFLHQTSLDAHRKAIHCLTAEPPLETPKTPSTFPCDHCPASFKQLCALKSHLRVHKLKQPEVCPLCGIYTAGAKGLWVHQRYGCTGSRESGNEAKREMSDDGESEKKKHRADEELPVQICKEEEDPIA